MKERNIISKLNEKWPMVAFRPHPHARGVGGGGALELHSYSQIGHRATLGPHPITRGRSLQAAPPWLEGVAFRPHFHGQRGSKHHIPKCSE